MGLATPVRNSTRISKRSVENPPPAETKTTENPKEKEKLKQDPAKNTTQEASHNENVEIPISSQNKTQNPPKDQKTELKTEIPNLSQNATLIPPKTAENQNKTNTEVEDQGPAYGNQTDGTNLKLTSADGRNHTLAKVKEQSDLAPHGEGFDVPQKPFDNETDFGGYKNSTYIGDRQNQDNSGMIDPSDQTTFSSSSRIFHHDYFPMVHVVLFLWLAIHMYPKVKRFFNWIQKSLTKTGRNTRRMMKQKN